MKKVTFLLATLLIGGMMLTGCKKDPQPTPSPTPGPTPTPTTKTVVYKVDNIFKTGDINTGQVTTHTVSPCFHYSFSFKDANGNMVEVNDATLPWTKEISVNVPFEAKIEGKVTYNEADLPEQVEYARIALINGEGETAGYSTSKADFIEWIATHPDKLEFSKTKTIQ
ncbi:MAG: hypothetical protein IKD78_02075 [Bacteroidales bacterium]|jgi:hypothetical protein|nr:hypothetical protein [Bacteroidales bacterium]MBR6931500.1 hypothetical protein [Bacteroidales bacterium]MBR6931626.1 hypothetical protein [Bacteroidales bacterium]